MGGGDRRSWAGDRAGDHPRRDSRVAHPRPDRARGRNGQRRFSGSLSSSRTSRRPSPRLRRASSGRAGESAPADVLLGPGRARLRPRPPFSATSRSTPPRRGRFAFVLAFAGGAVLTMLANTMMPEALHLRRQARRLRHDPRLRRGIRDQLAAVAPAAFRALDALSASEVRQRRRDWGGRRSECCRGWRRSGCPRARAPGGLFRRPRCSRAVERCRVRRLATWAERLIGRQDRSLVLARLARHAVSLCLSPVRHAPALSIAEASSAHLPTALVTNASRIVIKHHWPATAP